MSAPEMGQRAANRTECDPNLPFERQKMLSSEISTDNYRVSGGCADLLWLSVNFDFLIASSSTLRKSLFSTCLLFREVYGAVSARDHP